MMRRSSLFLLAASLGVLTPTATHAQDAQYDTLTDAATLKEELPLNPGRTVSFRATEGSWMSLDVSPDGQTVAFDLLGDIYTVPPGRR